MRKEVRTRNPLALPLQECLLSAEGVPAFLDDLVYGCCRLPEYGTVGLAYDKLLRVLTRLVLISSSEVYSLLYHAKYNRFSDESDKRQARRYAAAARHVIAGLRSAGTESRYHRWHARVTRNVEWL